MKTGKIHIVLVAAVVVAVITGLSFSARSSDDQRSKKKASAPVSPLKPTAKVTGPAPAKEALSAFAPAATQNALLKNDLTWTFGGKQQHGWHLYDLLIGKTLNTNNDTVTVEFASELAKWQKRMGLKADGVLDEDSLMRFISQWQSNRLKTRDYPDPSQLLTAPVTDFYDPSRAPELRQVERNTYAAYKAMVAAAIADPALNLKHTSRTELAPREQFFKIVSSFRSREYQDELRRKSPNSGTAGLAVNSPHFTGRALDLYVGGDPVDTTDSNRAIQVNTPAYRWLVQNAERFGFRPYFYEPWHWEYVK